jgi:hypothetical protein
VLSLWMNEASQGERMLVRIYQDSGSSDKVQRKERDTSPIGDEVPFEAGDDTEGTVQRLSEESGPALMKPKCSPGVVSPVGFRQVCCSLRASVLSSCTTAFMCLIQALRRFCRASYWCLAITVLVCT